MAGGSAVPQEKRRRLAMSRIVSLVALVVVVLVVGALSYRVMASFLLPMFLAVLLVVVFRPLHQYFLTRARGHDRLAAAATTVSILLIVLVPTLLILGQAAGEAYKLATDKKQQTIVANKLGQLNERFGLEAAPPGVLERLDQLRDTVDELRKGPALEDLPGQKPQQRQTIDALEHQANLIRAELGLDGPAAIKGPQAIEGLSPRRREMLTSSWQTLHELIEQLKTTDPASQEFAPAIEAVDSALATFRDDVLGSAWTRWLRRQLNPDAEQRSALLAKAQEIAGPLVLGTGQFLGSLLIGLGVMVISLYYFLADGPAMIRTLMRLSPLDDRYEEQLLTEFATVSRAVVVATLLSAFAQGLLASIGYYFAGFDSVFLLTVLTMFLAMVPFVGAAGVWGGCALWLYFYDGRTAAAVALAVYGAAVVSMIDNLIKPMVLHGQSSLHPLLALLSVLGGVKAMGPIGIFIGPMAMAFLQALLNMLHTELTSMGGSKLDGSNAKSVRGKRKS
jgi:predicted PurR-regulated permease PerM